jgi:hypothetical protein
MVNLSGRGYRNVNGNFDVNATGYLLRSLENIKTVDARRVVLFTNLSFTGFGTRGWTEKALGELQADVKAGARGRP